MMGWTIVSEGEGEGEGWVARSKGQDTGEYRSMVSVAWRGSGSSEAGSGVEATHGEEC